MKLAQKYIDVLETCDWAVSSYTDDGRVELETCSPAGEDLCICVEVKNFPAAVMKYWEDFDPDEHAEELILAKRNGFQGVPSVSVLINDAQAIDAMIKELADALSEADVNENMTQGDRSELLGCLIDVVEDWLEAKGFSPEDFPNDDRAEDEDEAIICGKDYDHLADNFANVIGIARYCTDQPDQKKPN